MKGLVTNIQGYSNQDGPGNRMLVFFKGCGLECQWCANPECISPYPEVGFFENLCTGCGKCSAICPEKALFFDGNGRPSIDRSHCAGCGECVSVCDNHALVMYGKQMSVSEVFEMMHRDGMRYQASGGGVTVSGGEPLLQSHFVCALFEECRKANIHTCIETSGALSSSNLDEVLTLTDFMVFDLKHMNPDQHRKLTGLTNSVVLDNARRVAQNGVDVLFRMHLIPGINDGLQNIRETAVFLTELGSNTRRIQLMPYHRLGQSKYQALSRPCRLASLTPAEPSQIEVVKCVFQDLGIECSVGE